MTLAHTTYIPCLILFLIAISIHVFAARIPQEFLDSPPLYCSAIGSSEGRATFVRNRRIPELKSSNRVVKLKQVQVLIRHGSRTLFEPFSCWKGYKPQYDCRDIGEVSASSNPEYQHFAFAKQYDSRPEAQMPNSCQYGQLVKEGYEQHKLTGEILAKTYFSKPHPLVDLEEALRTNKSLEGVLFFRATEFERTRMSGGQLISWLIRTTFPDINQDPHIQLHTAYLSKETLFPNNRVNPHLDEIHNRAFASDDYNERFSNRHARARELADRMFQLEETQPGAWPKEVMDCLYTSICGGFDVPDGFSADDFKTVLSAVDEEWQYEWRFNNAEFSKKAHSRLFVEMKGFIIKMFPQFTFKDSEAYHAILPTLPLIRPIPFILWSAHDSTVAPFLATFGEQMWNATGDYGSSFPPYASMVVLEVYETESVPMIRLIYNGKVMTQYIQGCPATDELCQVDTFFQATTWATPAEALAQYPLNVPTGSKKFRVNIPQSKRLRHHVH